ncbi:MAG: hypothetical protein QXZ62_04970 [Candidatus Caldarchaeum sp.]
MLENVMLHVSRLRRSHYNPRMVEDPEKKRILVESIRARGETAFARLPSHRRLLRSFGRREEA